MTTASAHISALRLSHDCTGNTLEAPILARRRFRDLVQGGFSGLVIVPARCCDKRHAANPGVRSLVTNDCGSVLTDEQNHMAFADTSASSQDSSEYGAKFATMQARA